MITCPILSKYDRIPLTAIVLYRSTIGKLIKECLDTLKVQVLMVCSYIGHLCLESLVFQIQIEQVVQMTRKVQVPITFTLEIVLSLRCLPSRRWSLTCSSAETEYRTLALVAWEVICLTSVLTELRVKLIHKPMLIIDTLSAKLLTANPVIYARMKYVEVNFHFI